MASIRDVAGLGLQAAKQRIPHALVGALLGGAGGYAASRMDNEPLRRKVDELSGIVDRSLGQSMNLGQSQMRLAIGEWEAKHPKASTALGALGGAQLGVSTGPAFVSALRSGAGDMKGIYEALRGGRA